MGVRAPGHEDLSGVSKLRLDLFSVDPAVGRVGRCDDHDAMDLVQVAELNFLHTQRATNEEDPTGQAVLDQLAVGGPGRRGWAVEHDGLVGPPWVQPQRLDEVDLTTRDAPMSRQESSCTKTEFLQELLMQSIIVGLQTIPSGGVPTTKM